MKINYLGIVAAILAFVSLALPWWTMPMSGTATVLYYGEMPVRGDISVYTYDATGTMRAMGVEYSESIVDDFSLWYGYVALVLIVIAGIAAIGGSLTIGKQGKYTLIVAAIFALLSITIFAVGLQNELSKEVEPGYPGLLLISRGGSFSRDIPGVGSVELHYSTYLTFGFWVAVAAALIALVASDKHPMAPPPAPTPPTPVPAVPPEPSQAKIHCVYCGAENPLYADFCLKCGKKMVKP